MEDKMRRDDTITGMSVQDVLDEVNNDTVENDCGLLLDEILAEFTDKKKNLELPQKEEVPMPLKSEKPEEKVLTPVAKEEPIKTEKLEETLIHRPEIKESRPQGEKGPEDISNTKVKLVRDIVRPWEGGVYGDMKLEDDTIVRKPHADKKRISKLAETFDTFTQSELFEDKNSVSILETRSASEIIKENQKISRLLGLRTICLLVISVILCYLAFSAPLGWYVPPIIAYINHPFRYLFITAFFQILAMLISIDVLSNGLGRMFKLKPCADSAIAFSSFASLAHVITIMAAPGWRGWLPYSSISALSLFFAILSKWLKTRAITRVCKTAVAAKQPSGIYVENMYGQMNVIKQSCEDVSSFVSHINDKDSSQTFWTFLAPIVIVSSIVFAGVSSFGTKTPEHFFWALAAISSVSTPFFALMSFSLPFSVVAKSLGSIGVAISGWYSVTRLSKKTNLVVGDSDLFPKGTITLHGLKILGAYSLEQTISYAASMISETRSGLVDVFTDLLKSRYGETVAVSNLRYHESGGIEAEIGGDVVLMGSGGFMLRSGVRLSSGTNIKNAVYIAINSQPAGVFNINYKGNDDVGRALYMLVKKKIPVILAVRDLNLLPMMVEKTFNLPDGVLEYPEIEQRIDLSSEEQFISGDICAVITRSGLSPFAAAVEGAKKLRKATFRNICLSTACALIGMLVVFYLTFMQRPILLTPHTVFIYLMLWLVPAYLLSIRVKR